MFQDFKDLLSALNDNEVKYLIVGGWAVSHHAQPRATKDLDILIQPAPRNAVYLLRALQQFGAPVAALRAADFTRKGSFFRFGAPPIAIDILPEISGIEFRAAWKRRVTEVIDEQAGLAVHYISRADLISTKLAAGRPQDIADVAALREAGATQLSGDTPSPPRRRKAPRKAAPKA